MHSHVNFEILKKKKKKRARVIFKNEYVPLCYGRFTVSAAFVLDTEDCREQVANLCTVVTRVIRNPDLISAPSLE